VVAHSSSRIDFISRRYFLADAWKKMLVFEREFLDDLLEPLHEADPVPLPLGYPSRQPGVDGRVQELVSRRQDLTAGLVDTGDRIGDLLRRRSCRAWKLF